MLIPHGFSRPKLIALLVVLLLVVGGTLYLLWTYVLAPSGNVVTVPTIMPVASFGPDVDAALRLPDPAMVYSDAWFQDPLLQQLQNDNTLPITLPPPTVQADPFAPLVSRGSVTPGR